MASPNPAMLARDAAKLTGEGNWATWKFQLRHLLLAHELWEHVSGMAALPVDADVGAIANFARRQQLAMTTLVMSVSEALLYLITDCETPQAVWEALASRFERRTLQSKLYLQRQFFGLKMGDAQTVEQHLRNAKELADKLAAIAAPIPEDMQMAVMLNSLPARYDPLVMALDARGDDLTLAYVTAALMNDEQRRQNETTAAPASAENQALFGQQKRPFDGACYTCGKKGHRSRDCRQKSAMKAAGGSSEKGNVANAGAEESCISGLCALTARAANVDNATSWYIDSGATKHMTSTRRLLFNFRPFEKPETVQIGDGNLLNAIGSGLSRVKLLLDDGRVNTTTISEVLFVPKLACNLLSVPTITKKGKTVEFGRSECLIKSANGDTFGKGTLVDRIYRLDAETEMIDMAAAAETVDCPSSNTAVNLWHRRLCHLNEHSLKDAAKKGKVDGVNLPEHGKLDFCEGCAEGKLHRLPFKPVGEVRSTRRLELVHSDVCGPMSVDSLSGQRYFVTFTDDSTRATWVYFMKTKAEVLQRFKEFDTTISNRIGERIATLRTDNGGEYCSKEFKSYLQSRGITHETTVPHCPEQNGVAERRNRTLVEGARSILSHAGLSRRFWAEAVNTVAYTRNRVPTATTGKAPFELWTGRKPDVSHLRVFGCMAYSHVPDSQRKKLDPKAEKVRFVGYELDQKGYRLLNLKTNKLFVRRDVRFNELDFGHVNSVINPQCESSGSNLMTVSVPTVPKAGVEQVEAAGVGAQEQADDAAGVVAQEQAVDAAGVGAQEQAADAQPDEQQPGAARPQRQRRAPDRLGFDDCTACHIALSAMAEREPTTMAEAQQSEFWPQWKEAAEAEMQSLHENKTWELVELPKGRQAIGCKWVFKVKLDQSGNVDRFKGRLVAKGYAQRPGLDYDETFAPVVRYGSVRTLLAVAVEKGLKIHQMDAITAFLNGDLEEEVYMKQPEGFEEPGKEELVCRLKKALYGLKQAPRCWNSAFTSYMKSEGFDQSAAEPCVFVRSQPTAAIVAMYVDDLILLAPTDEAVGELKKALSLRFKMKDLGELRFVLGIAVDQSKGQVRLSQKAYIEKMVERFGMGDAHSVATPADLNVKLEADDGCSTPVDTTHFQSLVGSLLYAAMGTRPDIAQSVAAVARYCSAPNEAHLTAAKRILRYLKGTVDLALQLRRTGTLALIGYSDADWAGDRDTRRSTTGNVFLLAGGAVTWLSQKQTSVALSTAEAEYIALCYAAQEAVWLRRLLGSVGALDDAPTVIYEDNQGAIAMAKNPVAHRRTKHIALKYHYVRECVEEATVELRYCPTAAMVADPLTKPLPRDKFEALRSAMGLIY